MSLWVVQALLAGLLGPVPGLLFKRLPRAHRQRPGANLAFLAWVAVSSGVLMLGFDLIRNGMAVPAAIAKADLAMIALSMALFAGGQVVTYRCWSNGPVSQGGPIAKAASVFVGGVVVGGAIEPPGLAEWWLAFVILIAVAGMIHFHAEDEPGAHDLLAGPAYRRWLAQVLLSALLAGSGLGFLFTEVHAADAQGAVGLFGVTILGSGALLWVTYWMQDSSGGRVLVKTGVAAGAVAAVDFSLYAMAMKSDGPPTLIVLLQMASLITTLSAAWWIFGERPSRGKWAALGLLVVGIIGAILIQSRG